MPPENRKRRAAAIELERISLSAASKSAKATDILRLILRGFKKVLGAVGAAKSLRSDVAAAIFNGDSEASEFRTTSTKRHVGVKATRD